MIWYDMIWYDMIWYDMLCYAIILEIVEAWLGFLEHNEETEKIYVSFLSHLLFYNHTALQNLE